MGYRDFPQVDLVWGEQLVTTFLTRWRHLVTRLIPIRREVFHIFITLEKSENKFYPILIMRQVCPTRFSSTFLRRNAVLFCRSTNLYVCAYAKRRITHVAASARLSKLSRTYGEQIEIRLLNSKSC